MTDTKCHCGQPLHYTDDALRADMEKLTADLGEYLPVTVGKRTWRVQRHYIALHGIKGKDLAALGFEEITA
jgi:hypothetical protein